MRSPACVKGPFATVAFLSSNFNDYQFPPIAFPSTSTLPRSPPSTNMRHMTMATESSFEKSPANFDHIEKSPGNATEKNVSRSGKKSRRLYSFNEARKIARGHGFDSREEFLEYTCPGAYQVPKDADVVWEEEWNGWDDFLGIPLSFEEGREVARSLEDINTEDAYLNLITSKTIPDDSLASRLPYRPDLKYKSEWFGWDDFLNSPQS